MGIPSHLADATIAVDSVLGGWRRVLRVTRIADRTGERLQYLEVVGGVVVSAVVVSVVARHCLPLKIVAMTHPHVTAPEKRGHLHSGVS